MKVAILGCGSAGRALGRILGRSGHRLTCVTCRTKARARAAARFTGARRWSTDVNEAAAGAGLVLVCVPDDAIAAVARRLRLSRGQVVAHVSGVHSSEVLAPLRPRGALHPLLSFADPSRSARGFAGTFCAIDGDAAAVRVLRRVVRGAGGVAAPVNARSKAAYHAGAVFASNYVVAVFEAALRLFGTAGVGRRAAQRALSRLTSGTARNIAAEGVPRALTGPIERGDCETVRRHVECLARFAPGLLDLYRLLGRLAVEVARAKGTLGRAAARRMGSLLSGGRARRYNSKPR